MDNSRSPNEVHQCSRCDTPSIHHHQSESQRHVENQYRWHTVCQRHRSAAQERPWNWHGTSEWHETEKGLLDIQILAIVAIVEKPTVLAETSIWLNAIDHYAGLNYNLGVNVTIGLYDKGCIRCQ